jgi:hypothetical protein
MNAYIIAQEILTHYSRNRESGHTIAALFGATKVPSKVVIHGTDMKPILDKAAGEPVATISLIEIERGYLTGTTSPIVFDNFALQQVLGDLVGTIASLRKDNEAMQTKMKLAKSILS